MDKELISIHIGQAGCQIGNACWELFCLEHGVNIDGKISSCKKFNDDNLNSIFYETKSENYVPRAIYIDSEPNVIDEIRKGCFKDLFNPDYLINDNENAITFARAYFSSRKFFLKNFVNKLQCLVEKCDNLDGFLVYHSFSGGTGSGFTSLLMRILSKYYGKKAKIEYAIFPSINKSSLTIEPYNAVLNAGTTVEDSDHSFLIDNETLYDIFIDKLKFKKPRFKDINRLLAQPVNSIISGYRYDGQNKLYLTDLNRILTPIPRLHYSTVSFAPLNTYKEINKKELSSYEITSMSFKPSNKFIKINNTLSQYLSTCFMYRGEVNLNNVSCYIDETIKRKQINYVDCFKNQLQLGHSYEKPFFLHNRKLFKINRSVCLLENNTAIKQNWISLNKKFQCLYNKKAFVHWYLSEGMSEMEFEDALQNVLDLEDDYEKL